MNYKVLIGVLASVVVVLAVVAWVIYDRGQVYELTMAADSRHSESFAIAKAIADVTHRYYPNIEIEVIETQGSGQNMRLLDQGRIELATVQADTEVLPSARLLAQLYPDVFQLVVRQDSTIHSVADLKGRRIALPPDGSGQYRSFWFLASHYGLSPSDIQASPMSTGAANFAMLAGVVDAVFRVRAPGNQSILELIENQPTRLVPIDQASAMGLKQPAIEIGVIPKGSYRGDPPLPAQDMTTASVQRLLVASVELDEDIAAIITGVLFERRRDLVSVMPLAGFISPPDWTSGTFMPVHAGSQRYYDREKPSFLHENAELIALFMSIAAVLGSGLLGLRSRWEHNQKDRVDKYNQDLIRLCEQACSSNDRAQVERYREKLLEILRKVVNDLDNNRVTAEGFQFFSFTWEAVNFAIRDELKKPQHNPASVPDVGEA